MAFGEVIPFPKQETDESEEALEWTAIELYFMSPDGERSMNGLISSLDSTHDNLVKRTLALLKAHREEPDHIINVLLSEAGDEGLKKPEFVEAYLENPAMNSILGLREFARHTGGRSMEALYDAVLKILANITRYEMLHEAYDPNGPAWIHRTNLTKVHFNGGKFDRNYPDSYYHPIQ